MDINYWKLLRNTFVGAIGLLLLVCFGYVAYVVIIFTVPIPFTNQELLTLTDIDKICVEHFPVTTSIPTSELRVIEDQDDINNMINEIKSYADGWQLPGFSNYSPRQGPISVALVEDGINKMVIRIGHYEGRFYIREGLDTGRYLTEEEFNNIIAILEVDPQLAYHGRGGFNQ